jgi:predicted deacylase
MPEFISINDHKVGFGETKEIRLDIARMPTYTTVHLMVKIFRGKEDGPVLLLTGGMHGDEINGVEIIRRMIADGLLTPQKGSVIAIPLINIYGFIHHERYSSDGKDINRSFPGSKQGSLARQVANTLMQKIIPHIDLGVDCHAGGSARSNFPQLRCSFKIEKNENLARAFSAPVTLDSRPINQSFRKAAHKKGKQIFVYETGETHRFDEFGIQQGIDGILRLMKYLGMRDDAPEAGETTIYQKKTWLRARAAGLYHQRVKLGDKVEKRQILGHISDLYGKEWFTIKSPRKGRIIGINNEPVIYKGDALIHLAYNSL